MANFVQRMRELRIGERYTLQRLLGEGSWGKVYLGRDEENGDEVAIKLEHCNTFPSLLDQEGGIYELLESQPGFPSTFWDGYKNGYKVMVLELLGPSIEDLLRWCGGKFSLKTTLMLFDQLLHRFEVLHDIGYVHRDVKPENFLLGTGVNGSTVYMIDLGLALPYYNREFLERGGMMAKIPNFNLVGTCRYASIKAHSGLPQSPRDDLEALGYMMVYLMSGTLPWQGLKASTSHDKDRAVLECKLATTPEDLCRGLPSAFITYQRKVRALDVAEMPDYSYLRRLFQELYREQDFEEDYIFDWTIREFYAQHANDSK